MRAMASRRSRFEIYVDTLTEIKNGKGRPTHIMYGANLSWPMLKQTLEKLTAQGLVDEHPMEGGKRRRKIYTLTGKGDKVLNYINMMKELLEPQEIVEIPV